MKSTIRPYSNKDFSVIKDWWLDATKVGPTEDMLAEDGTFILELNGFPALCLTVLTTQVKGMAYIFSFIKNPLFKKVQLENYGQMLWDHCFEYAKNKGYTKVICFSDNEKLQKKYERFGMSVTGTNLAALVKEL